MDGYVTIGTDLDTKSFDAQIDYVKSQLDDIEDKLKKADMGFEVGDTQKLEAEYEKLTDKLRTLIKKKEELNKSDFSGLQNSVNNIGNSLSKTINRVTRWGLALFGIRSIYGMLSNSASILASRNEQLATDMEYIRFALASTLQPVIEKLIQLAYKLLTYVAYIAKAWFGVNIFANATTKAFEKQNKALSGSVKKAKQLQKTLTGFDEMNVLQDSGDVSSGGGGGGISLPSADLSSIVDTLDKKPIWLEWLAKNGNIIIAIISGIAGAIAAMKISELLKQLGLIKEGLTIIKTIGIGIMIAGIVYAIMSLLDYLKDPTWENFGKIIQGVGIALVGLGIIIGSVPLAVIGAGVLIVGAIIKYWQQIKDFFQNGIDWLTSKSDWIHEHLGDTIGNIYDTIVTILQATLNSFDVVFTSIKGIFDGLIKFIKGVFTGDWKMAWEGIKQIFSNVFGGIIGVASNVINTISKIIGTIASTVGSIIGKNFSAVINAVLSRMETILNTPINGINKLINKVNTLPGVNLSNLSTFKFPRLAKGGIVNMPGRGVPIGGAIAGEAGREAVLPLQDSQVLSEIADAIGRRITINANIVNTMNGRVISRELQKVQNDSDFAYNR